MSYVVLSTDASGERKVDEATTLDAALERVEQLRNDEGVSDVRVLREVPIEVKTYYKVVAVEEAGEGTPAVTATPVPPPPTSEGATPPLAAVADAAPSESVASDAAGADFFTPPPVRSHVLDEDGEEPAKEAAHAERRTSLFGRG